MIRTLKKAVTFVVVAFLAFQPASSHASDRDDSWKLQIRIVREQLPKLHKNLFHKTLKSDWDKSLDTLAENVPTMKDNLIRAEIMRIVASVGDSHTNAYYYGTFEVFPYEFQWFKDGIYCEAATITEKEAFCKRLVAIEDHPIDKIIELYHSYVSHDNDQWFKHRMLFWLIDCDMLESLGIVKNKYSTKFHFEDDKGKRVTVSSRTYNDYGDIPWDKDSRYQDAIRDNPPIFRRQKYLYWHEYISSHKLLYIQYNRCREYIDYRFSEFMADIKNDYENNRPKTIIVDLRNNTGGSSGIAQPLIQWLASLPLNDPSRLFVVIDKPTYSSGLINAVQLRQETKATFVGEGTGGKPNHFGEVKFFDLTFAKMSVFYSTRQFVMMNGEDPESLFPDVTIEVSSREYFGGIDPIVDAIVNGTVKIPERKPPPKPVLTREEKWTRDLDSVRNRLLSESKTINISVAEIERKINALLPRIAVTPDTVLALEIQSLVSAAGIPELKVNLNLPTLPFRLASVDDSLVVHETSKAYERLLGHKLTAIGRHKIDVSLMLRFNRLFPADNFNGMRATLSRCAMMPDVLKFIGLVEDPGKIELSFEDENNCVETVVCGEEPLDDENRIVLKPYDKPATSPLYLSRKNNYWCEFLGDTKTIYVRLSRFAQDSMLFEEFVDSFDKLYEANYMDRIVVDLRGNPGGAMRFADDFIRKVVIRSNAMRLPVFVLVDRYTGGSSVYYACMLKNMCKARIVGENTGTMPNHAGNPELVAFDNDMISIWIPTELFTFDQTGNSIALCPDIPVAVRYSDWLKGTDKALDSAVVRK